MKFAEDMPQQAVWIENGAFNPRLIQTNLNPRLGIQKPTKALWSSSVIRPGVTAWTEFMKKEGFSQKGRLFIIGVRKYASVLEFDEIPDKLSWKDLVDCGIDGVHYDPATSTSHPFGWDVESTVWLNPDELYQVPQ